MLTRNVETYATIPIPQRACADEELTRLRVWRQNSKPCQHRLSLSTGLLNFVSVRHKWDEAVYCEGFVVLYHASGVDGISDYEVFSQCCSREVDRVTGCI